MKPLAISTLSFALIAAWFAASTAAAEPKPQYGGFSPDADGHQAYLDYIHSLDMIPVEAGPELQSAIEAIPVETDISITPQQEGLGQLALRRGDSAQALHHFTAGLTAARQQGTPLEVALQLGSIASVCRNLGHIDRALSNGNEALSIYVAQGHAQGRCGTATLLADLYSGGPSDGTTAYTDFYGLVPTARKRADAGFQLRILGQSVRTTGRQQATGVGRMGGGVASV